MKNKAEKIRQKTKTKTKTWFIIYADRQTKHFIVLKRTILTKVTMKYFAKQLFKMNAIHRHFCVFLFYCLHTLVNRKTNRDDDVQGKIF